MKPIGLLILLILSFSSLYGQVSSYPKGVYMSYDEVNKKTPSLLIELEKKKRTKGEIKMTGGNDYKLYKSDKSISKIKIKRDFFAYSDGDTLFINCMHYKIQAWYTPLLSDGKYMVICGGLSMNPKIRKEQLRNRAQIGSLFGPIGGGIQGAKLAMLRFVYIIDSNSDQLIPVTRNHLIEMLEETPELLIQYKKEKEQYNVEVIVKYLTLINNKN